MTIDPVAVFVPRTDWSLFRPLLIPGIYRLKNKGEVVYVGQSRKVGDRLYTHWVNRRQFMQFDEVEVDPCDAASLNRSERRQINQYKPRHNRLIYRREAPGEPANPLERRYRTISREDQRYVDRSELTLEDRRFHINRLRMEAERRLRHAKALEDETEQLIESGDLKQSAVDAA